MKEICTGIAYMGFPATVVPVVVPISIPLTVALVGSVIAGNFLLREARVKEATGNE